MIVLNQLDNFPEVLHFLKKTLSLLKNKIIQGHFQDISNSIQPILSSETHFYSALYRELQSLCQYPFKIIKSTWEGPKWVLVTLFPHCKAPVLRHEDPEWLGVIWRSQDQTCEWGAGVFLPPKLNNPESSSVFRRGINTFPVTLGIIICVPSLYLIRCSLICLCC